MTKLISLSIVAIVLVGVVVFLFYRPAAEVEPVFDMQGSVPSETDLTEENVDTPNQSVDTDTTGQVETVTYSDSGYSPATITVKKGDTITFDNKSSKIMWPASAAHPTHKAYPGTDIEFCGTLQSSGAFDACRGYGSDESWDFKFEELGTWKYHNHLQPNHTGTIIVK